MFTFTLHYVYFQVLVMCLAAEIVACFAWYSDELCRWKSCGGSPSLCVTDMAPPFLLSLCAADSRKKNRSEMRGENRETEWESSRCDDIMCTAAKLQQHWNKGSHSHTAVQNPHLTLDMYSFTHTRIFTWFPLLIWGFIEFQSWFILQY